MKQLMINWTENPGAHHDHLQQVLEYVEERGNDVPAIRAEIDKMFTWFDVARTPEEVMINLGKLLEINVIEQDKLMKKDPANPEQMVNKDDSYPSTPEQVLLRTLEKFIADPCEAVKAHRAVVSLAVNKKESLEWTSGKLKKIIQNYRPSAVQSTQPPLAIRAYAATTFEEVDQYKTQGLNDIMGQMEAYDEGYNVSMLDQQRNQEFQCLRVFLPTVALVLRTWLIGSDRLVPTSI